MTNRYEVIDRKTGAVVGSYASKQHARNARDRKDMAYGAVRYSVRESFDFAAVDAKSAVDESYSAAWQCAADAR